MYAAANLLGPAQQSLGLLQQTAVEPMAALNPEIPCQRGIFVYILARHAVSVITEIECNS